MAAMMAVNEFPELLALTDNVNNDYVSVQKRSDSSHQIVIRRSTTQLIAVPVAIFPTVELSVAVDSNFVLAPAAKSPRGLLSLLVTLRT